MPVTYKGKTYRNIYCARCNYAGNYQDLEFWEILLPMGTIIKNPNNFLGRPLRADKTMRLPPKKSDRKFFNTHGMTRMSQLCFTKTFWDLNCNKNAKKKNCTPSICENWEQYGCKECPGKQTNCWSNYNATWLKNEARSWYSLRKNFFDLSIIITGYGLEVNQITKEGTKPLLPPKTCPSQENEDKCYLPGVGNCTLLPSCSFQRKRPLGSTVTMVGLFISVFSLVLTLGIYCRNTSICTKIIQLQAQCFAAHLGAIVCFIAGGFLTMRFKADGFCKASAIVTHFAFLSVFSWMNVIAWSLFTLMRGTQRFVFIVDGIHASKLWEFLSQFVFGWALPLIITAVSAGLEFCWKPGFMGYGKDGFCWIGSQKGLLYLFLVSRLTSRNLFLSFENN